MEVGRSLSERPPLFTGTDYKDYMYWKVMMKLFIKAMDYGMWLMIKNGPHRPTKIVNGIPVDKQEDEWDENDKRLIALEAKAMHVLFCALDSNGMASVYSCDSAKAIWNTLELIHEGNAKAKEMKIDMLQRDYEVFRMKPNESIDDMFSRLMHIINAMRSLGKTYTDDEHVDKILMSLSRSWMPTVLLILEIKCHDKMNMNKLIGHLRTYEMRMKREEKEGQIVCYRCNGRGHTKAECPQLRTYF